MTARVPTIRSIRKLRCYERRGIRGGSKGLENHVVRMLDIRLALDRMHLLDARILEMTADGYEQQEIARVMNFDPRTVKRYQALLICASARGRG